MNISKSGKSSFFFMLVLVLAFSLPACGKKQENKIDPGLIALYEHDFRDHDEEEKTDEPVIDENGFTLVDDTVYVISEATDIKASPVSASEGLVNVKYGTGLHRTGSREDGWYKVEYEGNVGYILKNDITEMTLDSSADFTYAVASLDIVDTTRQFYSYDDMVDDLNNIRKSFPKVCSLSVIGLTSDNRNVYEMTIGNRDAENNIMIIGGMEACEYMTSLFAVKLCEYYAHYSKEGRYNGYSYSELLSQCCVHIIPMLNPDGVSISQFGLDGVSSARIKEKLNAWYERDRESGGINLLISNYLMLYLANAEGTEITKNFPYQWENAGSNDSPGSKGYKGEEKASEAETQDVMRLIDYYEPDLILNLRTTGNKVLYNFGSDGKTLEKCNSYAELLSEKLSYEKDETSYSSVIGGSLEGYAACEKQIPVLRICVGNGDAPLFLNEYNTIWSSGRESVAALMVYIINKSL